MIRISQKQKLLFGVVLLGASLLSTVVAATVTINTNNRVEFGQGLYKVGACDSFVDISAESNGTNITQIIIDGLDIKSCPNTYLRIKFFGSGNSPLNLYEESDTAVNRILLFINGKSGRIGGIDFLNSQGLVPNPYENYCSDPFLVDCKSDGYLDLDYFEGRYRLIFAEPMAVPGAFASFTLETSGDPFTTSTACDVNPVVTTLSQNPGSLLEGAILDNLTIQNCDDKYIRIRFFSSTPNSSPLGIYRDSTGSAVNRVVLYVNGQSDFLTGLQFVHSQGTKVTNYQSCPGGLNPDCRKDDYLSLDYLNGRYTLKFETPVATFSNVSRYEVDVADELQP